MDVGLANKELRYYQNKQTGRIYIFAGKTATGRFNLVSKCMTMKDQVGQRNFEKIYVEIPEPTWCTCDSRMQQLGPWQHEPNLDYFYQRGPDRVCSFCGSMHWDDFEPILKNIEHTPDITIDCAKGYKIYIDRPNVKNAEQGAIKFYTWHFPRIDLKDKEQVLYLNGLIRNAQFYSNLRIEARMQAKLGELAFDKQKIQSELDGSKN